MVRSLKSIPIVGVQFMSACMSVRRGERGGEREGGREGGREEEGREEGRKAGREGGRERRGRLKYSRNFLDRAHILLAQSRACALHTHR
jgi:hypothetical protein